MYAIPGTPTGGSVGAVLAAAWAMRHTLFKILVCICLVNTKMGRTSAQRPLSFFVYEIRIHDWIRTHDLHGAHHTGRQLYPGTENPWRAAVRGYRHIQTGRPEPGQTHRGRAGRCCICHENTFNIRINNILEGATKIIEVPERHFYMLGDYLAKSFESRYWDNPFIHEDDILARLFTK